MIPSPRKNRHREQRERSRVDPILEGALGLEFPSPVVGVVASQPRPDDGAAQGVLFYLLTYGLMNVGAFALVTLVSRGATVMETWQGVAPSGRWIRPRTAVAQPLGQHAPDAGAHQGVRHQAPLSELGVFRELRLEILEQPQRILEQLLLDEEVELLHVAGRRSGEALPGPRANEE
mgnify:CR=1 FL=1